MKKALNRVVSISFFDVEFDNRVKKTLEAFGKGFDKYLIYNNPHDSSYSDLKYVDQKYINLNKSHKFKLLRILSIQLAFIIQFIRLRPQLIICNDIQPAPAVLIYRYFFRRKIKIIYDAHELEITLYPSAKKIIQFLERKMIWISTFNMTVNDSIAGIMMETYSRPVYVLPNYPSLSSSSYSKNEFLISNNLSSSDILIVYTGVLMSDERCLSEIVSSLAFLPDNYKFLIAAVGNIKEFKDFVYEKCNENGVSHEKIRFIGPYNESKLLHILSFCDVSLLLYNYRLSANLDINSPNKFYQAMVSGVHMLMSNNTTFKNCVNKLPLYFGELVDPSEIELIAKKIIQIVNREGRLVERDLIRDYGKNFSWEHTVEMAVKTFNSGDTLCK